MNFLTNMDIQKELDKIAAFGINVSFVYGPCGNIGVFWSVNVLMPDGREFEKPFLANSIEHAIEIVFKECRERKWIPNET